MWQSYTKLSLTDFFHLLSSDLLFRIPRQAMHSKWVTKGLDTTMMSPSKSKLQVVVVSQYWEPSGSRSDIIRHCQTLLDIVRPERSWKCKNIGKGTLLEDLLEGPLEGFGLASRALCKHRWIKRKHFFLIVCSGFIFRLKYVVGWNVCLAFVYQVSAGRRSGKTFGLSLGSCSALLWQSRKVKILGRPFRYHSTAQEHPRMPKISVC